MKTWLRRQAEKLQQHPEMLLPTPFDLPLKSALGWCFHHLGRRADLSQARCFVIFVGNPRSGTTLVRTLLDGHPHIVLGNEANVLARFLAGESWSQITGRILFTARVFAHNPIWNGYSYRLPLHTSAGNILVLGDKKSSGTTKLLLENPTSLSQFMDWLPLSLRIIHCVRHPFDVVSTKTKRNRGSLAQNLSEYFAYEKMAVTISQMVGSANYFRLYQESLIAEPSESLQRLFAFLEITPAPEYLVACRKLIYKTPHQSRFDVVWSPDLVAKVWQQSTQIEHLAYYLSDGKLLFHDP